MAPMGAPNPAGGGHVASLLGGHPACSVCTHTHRHTVTDPASSRTVVFDDVCDECPCRAGGTAYDGLATVVPVSAWRSDARYCAEVGVRPATEAASTPLIHLLANGCVKHGDSGLGVHPGPRVGGPVQRPGSAVGGLWDRVRGLGAHVAIARLLRRALAGPSVATGSGRAEAFCPVRLDAVEQPVRLRAVADALWCPKCGTPTEDCDGASWAHCPKCGWSA